MPTWEETRDHLRTKYTLMQEEAGWIGLGFALSIGGKEMKQHVRVENRTIGPIPALTIMCDVIEAARVPASKALERNYAFPIGGLVVHQGLMMLKATLPLEGLVFTTLDLILENLARDAAVLRDAVPAAS